MPIDFNPIIPYSIRVNKRETNLTSKENLKEIIDSLPSDTPEITVVVLKSQFNSKAKRPSLSKNG